ncbi:uncharacterized protein LOC135819238 [Sycon ciliatum]|uniref:uncharacterized protein LOC135819238 n=1 Tax=Sycon ciliatum TaxID=27933 RepID=UPI0031F63BCD
MAKAPPTAHGTDGYRPRVRWDWQMAQRLLPLILCLLLPGTCVYPVHGFNDVRSGVTDLEAGGPVLSSPIGSSGLVVSEDDGTKSAVLSMCINSTIKPAPSSANTVVWSTKASGGIGSGKVITSLNDSNGCFWSNLTVDISVVSEAVGDYTIVVRTSGGLRNSTLSLSITVPTCDIPVIAHGTALGSGVFRDTLRQRSSHYSITCDPGFALTNSTAMKCLVRMAGRSLFSHTPECIGGEASSESLAVAIASSMSALSTIALLIVMIINRRRRRLLRKMSHQLNISRIPNVSVFSADLDHRERMYSETTENATKQYVAPQARDSVQSRCRDSVQSRCCDSVQSRCCDSVQSRCRDSVQSRGPTLYSVPSNFRNRPPPSPSSRSALSADTCHESPDCELELEGDAAPGGGPASDAGGAGIRDTISSSGGEGKSKVSRRVSGSGTVYECLYGSSAPCSPGLGYGTCRRDCTTKSFESSLADSYSDAHELASPEGLYSGMQTPRELGTEDGDDCDGVVASNVTVLEPTYHMLEPDQVQSRARRVSKPALNPLPSSIVDTAIVLPAEDVHGPVYHLEGGSALKTDETDDSEEAQLESSSLKQELSDEEYALLVRESVCTNAQEFFSDPQDQTAPVQEFGAPHSPCLDHRDDPDAGRDFGVDESTGYSSLDAQPSVAPPPANCWNSPRANAPPVAASWSNFGHEWSAYASGSGDSQEASTQASRQQHGRETIYSDIVTSAGEMNRRATIMVLPDGCGEDEAQQRDDQSQYAELRGKATRMSLANFKRTQLPRLKFSTRKEDHQASDIYAVPDFIKNNLSSSQAQTKPGRTFSMRFDLSKSQMPSLTLQGKRSLSFSMKPKSKPGTPG